MGQLNNTAFDQPTKLNAADSGIVSLGFNTLGFTKNNEYFNKIADGYTLFGYQVNPYLTFQPLSNVSLSVGAYLQKDFGANGYENIQPTYTFKYQKNHTAIIFGTLEGSTMHRLIEPLYDFEKVMVDRLENGIQLKVDRDNLYIDGWVDWQKMIYKGDANQEEITAGLSSWFEVWKNDNYRLKVPVQLVVHHQGGQIDNNPNPLKTLLNSAMGLDLTWQPQNGSLITSVNVQPYYAYYKDFSFEKRQTFEDGSAFYLNLSVNTKYHLRVMASYWQGHEFMSIMGGQLYPSVSSTYKNPFYVERNRQLLILRFMHELKLADNLKLSTRFEPYYDFQSELFEFSHGFYLTYTTDFKLNRNH